MGRQLPPLCVCHGSPTPTSPSLSSLRCLNRTIHGVRKLAAWEDKILCAADASFGRRPQPTEMPLAWIAIAVTHQMAQMDPGTNHRCICSRLR
ncbi:hypothetical protein BDA96_05G140900 [Sorghum bicolor]|uniref:Uncharacterized protein n=1 Tax=Sorghum bicolor TaxID=4558 RepID=A0A921QZU3_SORBI|nr:hypothetical protein BDA96_05G140900 [Sorghum bicolor]